MPFLDRSLGNGVHKNGVRNRCPYRRCGVDTEIPYQLPFWREFCWVLPVLVASGVDTEFPYRVRIVDRGGVIAATLFADTISDPQIRGFEKGLADRGGSLKTVTSLNKEARLLRFHLFLSDDRIWGQ